MKSDHPRALLWLILWLPVGCEPATPVDLPTSVDASLGPADFRALDTQPSSVEDSSVSFDVSQCGVELCGNNQDEDCDGVVDECGAGLECQAGECVDPSVGTCATNFDCADTELCISERCSPYRVTSCGESSACGERQMCDTVATCSTSAECYGVLGAECEAQCDCGNSAPPTGGLICEIERGQCVQCLNNGQCDGDASCNPSGHCAPSATIASGSLNSVRQQILGAVHRCLMASADRYSRGCAGLTFEQPFEIDGTEVGRLSATGLLGDDVCSTVTAFASEFPLITLAFGCGSDNRSRVIWSDAVDTRLQPAACILYRPYFTPLDQPEPIWTVWFGSCESALQTIQ